jgi:divalent metal cation (Fe/Co/Zn/Cd) transporter
MLADKQRVALSSVLASGFMTATKLVAGLLTGSLSLEMDARQTLGEAHAAASALEAAICDEIGSSIEVETYIEPAIAEDGNAGGLPPAELAALAESVHAAARNHPAIHDVHKLRARRSGGGLFITLHCRVTPEATLETVHAAVDEFEHDVLRRLPQARRVVVHAEPLP